MKRFNFFSGPVSFRVLLPLYIVLPMVTALGVFGYFALSSIEKQVVKQMQKDVELVARAVKLPLSYALEKDRTGGIRQALESVFSIGRVYSAYVYDKDGEELFRLGAPALQPRRKEMNKLAADGRQHGEYGHIAGRQVYSYFVPLTDLGGRIIGMLHLTRKESEFRDHVQSIRLKGALGLGGILVILSGMVLYGHHRVLGRHLVRLSSLMSRIAGGDYNRRFDNRGPREIAELGAAFNHMLDSMEEARRMVNEHRKKQRNLEEELQQAQKLAALGRLAAGTAHELGTPLSVISGKAQRALRMKTLSRNHRKAMEAIREEVKRMEYIIRQLLDFSRRGSLRCSDVNPSYLLESSVSAVEDEAAAKGVDIKISGSEDSVSVRMDPVRVQQALTNMLRNAIQCSSGGNVHCCWEPREQGAYFRVDDDGPGVPPEIRSKIFDPFFTTKKVGEGTGLGLSIVHTVAQEHGGAVRLDKSNMGGSCFGILIRDQFPLEKGRSNDKTE